MKLQLKAQGVELTAGLRDLVKLRVHSALGRFASRIRKLSVRLSDENGPRGGVDKCCCVTIDAGLPHPLIVREKQDNFSSAVIGAVGRAERSVERQLRLRIRAVRRTGSSFS